MEGCLIQVRQPSKLKQMVAYSEAGYEIKVPPSLYGSHILAMLQ